MNFLEKNLEDIIWEHPDMCYARGLRVPAGNGIRIRQLNLAPYGIADLVYININKGPEVAVTIIECKRDIVDLAAYGQASRYQTALYYYLSQHLFNYDSIEFQRILIGKRVDPRQDFLHILAADSDTLVYTYTYKHDGIAFEYFAAETVNGLLGKTAKSGLPGASTLNKLIEDERRRDYLEAFGAPTDKPLE
jgi:hypothetical protein